MLDRGEGCALGGILFALVSTLRFYSVSAIKYVKKIEMLKNEN